MWHILSGCRAVRQRKCDAVARHGSSLERRCYALPTKCNFGDFSWRELYERLRMPARDDECVTCVGRADIEKRDRQTGLKHDASGYFIRENLAEDATHVRLTPQFSGRAPPCDARRVCTMK